jgi:hypothetical protein
MAVDPPRVTPELTLLSRVAYRGREVTGPRPRGLLALLAGDLRSGGSTARLVEGLWPEEQPEHPAKALQVIVSRTRAQLGADVIASTPSGYRLSLAHDQVDASAVLLRAAAAWRCWPGEPQPADRPAPGYHAQDGRQPHRAHLRQGRGDHAARRDPVRHAARAAALPRADRLMAPLLR